MNRGYYNAASAMLTIQKHMQSTANNIANVSTTAYKREKSIEGTFDKMMLYYRNDTIGHLPSKVGLRDNVTIFSQGSFQSSGRDLDLALGGEGFFKLQDENGRIRYTRNGVFFRDENNFIVDSNGYYLFGSNGKIQVDNGTLTIKENGDLYIDGNLSDKIQLVDLESPFKTGKGYYSSINETTSQKTNIYQGFIESSNVDMGDEISNLMKLQRSYQLNQRMVLTQDDLNKKCISDLFK